jgi:hypothetical protein
MICTAGVLDAAYLDSRRDENGTSYLEAARAGELFISLDFAAAGSRFFLA